MNEESLSEVDIYKYLLRITEDLLMNGGYPTDILSKYKTLKEIKISNMKKLEPQKDQAPLKIQPNEQNEFSFQKNELDQKDLDFANDLFTALYESLSGLKSNLAELTKKEPSHNPLKNIALKPLSLSEEPISEGCKSFKKVLLENWQKLPPIFQEFDPLLKSLLNEFSNLSEYIKNLEAHIQTFNEIQQNPEPPKVNQENAVSSNYKKLIDKYASIQIACETYKEKVQNLEAQILSDQQQYIGIINDLQNKNQYLEMKYDDILKESLEKESSLSLVADFERIFDEVLEKFSSLKEKFIQEKSPNRMSDKNAMKFRFLKYLFEKFEEDNLWLVEKLKELTIENTELIKKLQNIGNISDRRPFQSHKIVVF